MSKLVERVVLIVVGCLVVATCLVAQEKPYPVRSNDPESIDRVISKVYERVRARVDSLITAYASIDTIFGIMAHLDTVDADYGTIDNLVFVTSSGDSISLASFLRVDTLRNRSATFIIMEASTQGLWVVDQTNTVGARLNLMEDPDNGGNYVTLRSPDALGDNILLTLPSSYGTAGQVLRTAGASGILSWVDN